MAAEPLLPVYLLLGTDRPKVRRALARLRARVGDEALEVFDAGEANGAEAAAACNAMGLFGSEGSRLVLVEGVERWNDDDAEAIATYAANPAPGSVLALVAEEAPKTKKLADACAKAGRVLRYDAPKPRDLASWVRESLARVGAQADTDAARALVDICGDDLTALASEVEKLAAWAAGEPITRADVELLAVPSHDAPGWAITDAWGARSVAAVLDETESELERGSDPFLVATRVAGQVGLVRSARRLADEGLATKDIAKRLRRHEFRIRKALAHADAYTEDELDAATVRLAALDAALKGSSRLSGELELSRALVDVTRTSA